MNDRFSLSGALSGGAVIVGSILLAFAIDAGWDAYRERADEQAVLASLDAEFVSNLETLERVIRRHEGFAERAADCGGAISRTFARPAAGTRSPRSGTTPR